MKVKDLIKSILYIAVLFGITALLIPLNYYGTGAYPLFCATVIICAGALLNGFSLIALIREKIFYAVSDLVCIVLWSYPIYTKASELLNSNLFAISILITCALLLPALILCEFTIISCIKKSGQMQKMKKSFSVIGIVLTSATVLATVILTVIFGFNAYNEVKQKKQDYTSAVKAAEEITAEYQKNDLIIEEILDSRRLTYDTDDDNTYIVEDFDGLNITIYTKNNKSENKNTVCVSSSSIGIGIPKWFFIEFYQGQSQSLPLTK